MIFYFCGTNDKTNEKAMSTTVIAVFMAYFKFFQLHLGAVQ